METREKLSSPRGTPANNGGNAFSSLPASLYRDQIRMTRANSGIAELLVVIGVCATLAGMIAASVQGAIAADEDMSEFAEVLGVGAFCGFLVALIVSFCQSPRVVTIPVAILFGPLVGAAIAAVLTVPESYRANVGMAAIGGAVVLGLVVLIIDRLRGRRS